MLAVLDWIYGPMGASDPNYLLMRDIIVFLPWWYPYMWLGIGAAYFMQKSIRKRLRERKARLAGNRVLQRTERLMSRQARELAAKRLSRRPANDFLKADRSSAA